MTGIISNAMKIVKILISGNTFSFYRPISILPAFSKIIMHFTFNFLNSSEQYYKHQYGYKKGHSSLHPQLMNRIAQENDNQKFTLRRHFLGFNLAMRRYINDINNALSIT